ncbi:hypothetical protein Y032_0085g1848 [Ancylostoma ceylanicum]|uniref:Uncharacterized protein n=1 Tax=Ancylostoma ceylanicum TaxID=53326 RepID=A0A016TR36_9BILA|nr:hypothetical protein Y032_0085g1848 [Ancylostoma ceylanicum]
MLSLLVWFAATFLVRVVHAQLEDKCCCGCPVTPCPITLSRECLADPTTPCFRSNEFNASKIVVNCRVFLEAMGPVPNNQQQEFVPISRDTVPQQFGGQSFVQQQPFQGAQVANQHGVFGGQLFVQQQQFQAADQDGGAMMEPSLMRTSFMSPVMMGGPHDVMGMHAPISVQPIGWGTDVGNLVGGILDGVRNIVGTTLSGGNSPMFFYQWFRK